MKVKFKVEKDYKGKKYYPNIEYVFDDDTGKDILSKTKYAEKVEEVQESPLKSGNEEQKVDAKEQKPTKSGKKVAKNVENSQ